MITVWSPRGVEHLAHLRSYIARDNPKAANQIAGTLLDAVERLAELPNLGRPGRVAGTRELVVPGTPYVIPYRLRGDRLEVIGSGYVAIYDHTRRIDSGGQFYLLAPGDRYDLKTREAERLQPRGVPMERVVKKPWKR